MNQDRPEAAPLHHQIECLHDCLTQNAVAEAVLAAGLALPDWYLGAGGVAQTVWNLRHGFDAAAGIKDYDLVYSDLADLSEETERRFEDEVASRVADFGVEVDVKNEARVHLWYGQRFGRAIEPYNSAEQAIATWPTTASCVGVRRDSRGFAVCAPFGLADLLGTRDPPE